MPKMNFNLFFINKANIKIKLINKLKNFLPKIQLL